MKNRVLIILIIALASSSITYLLHNRIVQLRLAIPQLFDKHQIQESSLSNRIKINVKDKDLSKLESYRSEALKNGTILSESKEYIKADLLLNDVELNAKIRFKGDNVDHIDSDKWSFRVKLKSSDHFFNNNTFSIQHPKTRSYLYEWALHKTLASQQILTTDYDFVQVFFNGTNKGIYAIEDHFTEFMLKKQNRTPGPIIRFNEDVLWQEEAKQYDYRIFVTEGSGYNDTGSIWKTPLEIYSFKMIENSDSIEKEAIDLFYSFVKGNKAVFNQHFDKDLWAKYFSVMEIFGAKHGANWHNLRFYFNPQTKKFEPIGFDGSTLDHGSILHAAYSGIPANAHDEYFLRLFFDDLEFSTRYLSYIHQFLNSNIYDSILISPEYLNLKQHFEDEFGRTNDLASDLQFHQNALQEVYNPVKPLYALEKEQKILLANSYSLHLEVISYTIKNDTFRLDTPLHLAPTSKKTFNQYVEIDCPVKIKKGAVQYKILGLDSVFNTSIENYY